MEEKFEYSGTLSAPYEYPIEVIDGRLISEDYEQSFVDWGITNIRWGNSGGMVVAGPDFKDVPHQLDITWRSFQEDKWYTGDFKLPKEKMKILFEEGYINRKTNKKNTYSTVIIGLAPQGNIVVWLGGAGHKREIATFKAKQIKIKQGDYGTHTDYMFRENYVDRIMSRKVDNNKKVQEHISKRGAQSPKDIYINTYRKQYTWKPIIELSKNSKLTFTGLSLYNGEFYSHLNNDIEIFYDNYKKHALLFRFIRIEWKNEKGEEYLVSIKPSFNELSQKIMEFQDQEKIDIVVQITEDNTLKKISIKSTEKEIELRDFEISAYKKK